MCHRISQKLEMLKCAITKSDMDFALPPRIPLCPPRQKVGNSSRFDSPDIWPQQKVYRYFAFQMFLGKTSWWAHSAHGFIRPVNPTPELMIIMISELRIYVPVMSTYNGG